MAKHWLWHGSEFSGPLKEMPAFAAEFAAVALRNERGHWGPIIHRAAEVRPEADEMFRDVEAQIESSGLCPALT